VQSEVEHGRFLAEHDAEEVWGWNTPAGRFRATRRAELVAVGAGLASGSNALEIGCGTGLFTETFAKSGARILAVDISEELLVQARARGLPSDRVRFLAKPFEDCNIDGPFDAVIGSSVLHHLDLGRALPKIRELLKPGGKLCFAEPNMLNPQIMVQKNIPTIKKRLGDSPDETAFVRWSFKRRLEAEGFKDVEITPFDWLHPWTPVPLIPAVRSLGRLLEHIPLVREFSGSLLIKAAR
jgi:2-polyprenyl-3-methyl-5-hydroxy-6-metoxy-1,4-benzoquinol methylase